jgi:hypothetical protein
MKKILLSFSLIAMLIAAACDTSKSSVATVAAPQSPATPAMPQKGEMKESEMKPIPSTQYIKKAPPTKGGLQPMEALIEADSVVPKRQ